MAKRTEHLLALLFVTAAFLIHLSRFLAVGDTDLTVWGDRDLWRALEVARQWPVLGPETNGGLRTPGGAFYLMLAASQALAPGYLSAHVLLLALFALAMLALGLTLGRDVSPLAGALAAAAFAGSGLLWQAVRIWNPGYVLFFATLLCLGVYRFLRSGRAAPLGLATASLAMGLQIHMQIAQLAAGLLVALLLARPKLTWRLGGIALLGFVLPYLPTLSANSLDFLAMAAAMPAEAVTTYGSLDFDWLQKLSLVYEVFGGTGSALGSPGPWGLALDGADLLAIGLGGLGLALAGREAWRRRRLPAEGIFAVAVLVYLAIAMVAFVNLRHMVAVLPAAAAVIGLAGDRLLRRLLARGPLLKTIAALLVLLLLARPLALALSGLLRPAPFSPETAAAQQEIAATLKPTFYGGHEGFEAHAALFQRNARGNWLLVQGGIADHMAFIYRTTPAAAIAADRDDCVAILPRAGVVGDPRPQLAPALRGITPRFTGTSLESEHFLFFPYSTEDGNCLKTFPNAYIPAGSEGDLGVDVEPLGDGRYRAVLVGRSLRGYTGLPFRALSSAVLCLAGPGGTVTQALARLTVGSPLAGTLAPWRSPGFTLAGGRYHLWLTAFDERKGSAIELPLGGLSLPDGARTAEAGPFPEGCPRARR